jgi:hypothetical protein
MIELDKTLLYCKNRYGVTSLQVLRQCCYLSGEQLASARESRYCGRIMYEMADRRGLGVDPPATAAEESSPRTPHLQPVRQ